MSTKQKKSGDDVVKGGPSSKSGASVMKESTLALKAASLREYFEESKIELKKVNWPARKEVRVTAIAVLILVVVMSVFLGILDIGLVKLMELILSIGK